MSDPIEILRATNEDHIREALVDASFGNWPQDEASLLEFFHRVLDVRLGEGVGQDE